MVYYYQAVRDLLFCYATVQAWKVGPYRVAILCGGVFSAGMFRMK